MKFKTLKKKLLQTNPEFRTEYYRRNFALELGHRIAALRLYAGLTQEDLARKVGTQQPGIARAEGGNRVPSLAFLEKVATAFGKHLKIDFVDTELETFGWTGQAPADFHLFDSSFRMSASSATDERIVAEAIRG